MSKFRNLLIGAALAGLPALALAQTATPEADAAVGGAGAGAAALAPDTTMPEDQPDGMMAPLGPIMDAGADLPQPEGGRFGIGREALPEEIAAWDVNVMPDGRGLPEGQGSVADGEMLFSDFCAACHGEFAEGVDNWPQLAGGEGTLADEDPVKTVGSYWPYLSTSWDYIHRSMPYGAAQILTPDDTYAMVAYILYSNFLVDDDFVLSHENFGEIVMPNADGFIVDDRNEVELPIFQQEPCMENCKDSVEITMRATNLDVTPGDPSEGETEGGAGLEGGAAPVPEADEAPDSYGSSEGAPKEVPSEEEDAAATAAAEAVDAETASPLAEQQPAVEDEAEEGATMN